MLTKADGLFQRALMVQATTSDAGKSTLVAALCRLLARRGLCVTPFKPQNMSNNAAVTSDGGEIGRAQALQAIAARCEPVVDMNPILIKPMGDSLSEIVVHGKARGQLRPGDFRHMRSRFLPEVVASFNRLIHQYDFCVVEGAGSAVEINLRDGDIANMGFAEPLRIPVVLVVDVERGGSIASLVGAWRLLAPQEKELIVGFWINKFRGDIALYDQARIYLEKTLERPCWGVIPWFNMAEKLPAEDSLSLQRMRSVKQTEGPAKGSSAQTRIAIVRLPTISNFDEFLPLFHDPAFFTEFLNLDDTIPEQADWVILPGSRAVVNDLNAIRTAGMHHDIYTHVRRGKKVLGICGGFSMLAEMIHDPLGKDGAVDSSPGLGLLDLHITLEREKQLACQEVALINDQKTYVTAYEIHYGDAQGAACQNSWLVNRAGKTFGARNSQASVFGCYLHDILSDQHIRHALLGSGSAVANQGSNDTTDDILDSLADHVARHTTLEALKFLYSLSGAKGVMSGS